MSVCSVQQMAETASPGEMSRKGKEGLRSFSLRVWCEISTAPIVLSGSANTRISRPWLEPPVCEFDLDLLLLALAMAAMAEASAGGDSEVAINVPRLLLRLRNLSRFPGAGGAPPAPIGPLSPEESALCLRKNTGMCWTNSTHVKGMFMTRILVHDRVPGSSRHSSLMLFLNISKKCLPLFDVRTPRSAVGSPLTFPRSTVLPPEGTSSSTR
mmetsp:Transcript_3490/g.7851  ORF Transcript_3490/g.7851 Transcript_3490/m.7851 type:complete len:212 (-) Transcript_3490:1616-2251(-)